MPQSLLSNAFYYHSQCFYGTVQNLQIQARDSSNMPEEIKEAWNGKKKKNSIPDFLLLMTI